MVESWCSYSGWMVEVDWGSNLVLCNLCTELMFELLQQRLLLFSRIATPGPHCVVCTKVLRTPNPPRIGTPGVPYPYEISGGYRLTWFHFVVSSKYCFRFIEVGVWPWLMNNYVCNIQGQNLKSKPLGAFQSWPYVFDVYYRSTPVESLLGYKL